MVKPSTEAVQPFGSTFLEQEIPQTMERSSHWRQGETPGDGSHGMGVVSISISSELKAGLDAEVWLWSGDRWGWSDEELCLRRHRAEGLLAGAHQGPPRWANSMMELLTTNAGRMGYLSIVQWAWTNTRELTSKLRKLWRWKPGGRSGVYVSYKC